MLILYHITQRWYVVALYRYRIILFHCQLYSRSFSATSPSSYRCQNFVPRIVFFLLSYSNQEWQNRNQSCAGLWHVESFVHYVGFEGLGRCSSSWRRLVLSSFFFWVGETDRNGSLRQNPEHRLTHGIFCGKFNSGACFHVVAVLRCLASARRPPRSRQSETCV